MKSRTVLLLLFVCVVSAEAKDRPAGFATHGIVRANGGFGAFPEPPPKEDDTVFAVDEGPDLDTGCTYRRGGPLIIQLPVRRYVGEVRSDGTLARPGQLTGLGLLSDTALLSLPVYDVDEDGDPDIPSVPPEVDRIYFNGKELKRPLTGSTDRWKMNTFTIDIGLIKFPAKDAGPVMNEIRIEIDALNQDEDQWCTAVDWVALEFQAVAPIFLVHGVLSSGASWNDNKFLAAVKESKIPYSAEISLPLSGTLSTGWNGRILAGALQREADRFGARKCHIIAHSKGGLMTRAYLQDHYDATKLRVLSVYTLSTPHRGSPAADLIYALAANGAVYAKHPALLALLRAVGYVSLDLTTDRLWDFNRSHPPPPIPFFSYGAEADRQPHDQKINAVEAKGMLPAPIATLFYKVVGSRDFATVVTLKPAEWGDVDFSSISIGIRGTFAPNDVVVSENSAAFVAYVNTEQGLNHNTMKSEALARRITDHIVLTHGVR